MQRVFTKDVGENFRAGDIKDLPKGTWEHIARNIKAKRLEDFSKTVEEAVQPTK